MNRLIKLHTAFFVFIALISQLIANENNELPSLDEIRRLHIERSNERYNLDKLNSIFASGRILYYSENEITEREFRVYKKRPNKYRSFHESNVANKNVQLEVIFDGENAIKILSHGGRGLYQERQVNREKLQGEALESIKVESRLEGPFLLAFEENKSYITVSGYEYVEGEKCILLKIDERSKLPYSNIWLSAANFQEVKFDFATINNDEEKLEEVLYSNFKNVQGILFASRMDKFVNGKRILTRFVDEFNVNYGLYDSLFDLDLN